MRARPTPVSATATARNDQERRKERKLRTGKRHILWWTAVAFAAAAAAAPAGQALGTSPDARPFYRGTSEASAPTSVSPDDRPFYRGASEASAPTKLSPDDRPFYRGSSEALAPPSLSPDDRPFARTVDELKAASPPVEVVVRPRGFDWGDAVIGGTFGLALALLGTGAILIAQRRRSTPRPT